MNGKRVAVIALLAAAIVAIVIAFAGFGHETATADDAAAYLRVHIRANSNSEADQAVKYKVRDAVVEFLTPTIASCGSKEEAMKKIAEKLPGAEKAAERVLAENGFFYGARASLKREEFPTRVYSGATLAAGVYDALILELGSGTGDNWWCVVYPPLCFGGGSANIVYKSKIAEIIRNFFE